MSPDPYLKRWRDAHQALWAQLEPELLQYPPSLMTGAAVIEGVIVVLQRRYKATGVDGRGRPVAKRDARSLRKIAVKCSRGVRLDIQDILQITNVSLTCVCKFTCRLPNGRCRRPCSSVSSGWA